MTVQGWEFKGVIEEGQRDGINNPERIFLFLLLFFFNERNKISRLGKTITDSFDICCSHF